MKKFFLACLLAALLGACGGGGSDTAAAAAPAPVAVQGLVGEIIATPSHIASSELETTAGYAGNVTASYAIQAAGKAPLLALLFMRDADAEAKLARYVQENGSLLTPGVRVLIADELFWKGPSGLDTDEVLQPQLEAFRTAASTVRRYIPQAKVGITITPYATSGRPNTLEYAKRAIALADWVGTDPYWLGGDNVQELHDWSRTFDAVAKQANPAVETWFIAQAFKFPGWDTATYNRFVAQQLEYAENYDHILFFGWQFVSEIDNTTAGMYFAPETRALYSKYLK